MLLSLDYDVDRDVSGVRNDKNVVLKRNLVLYRGDE